MPHAVTITGSRRAGHREPAEYGLLFDAYLRPFAGAGSHFYLGGAMGIDSFALDWLAEHTPAVLTVVVPCTLADQPEQARLTVLSATRRAQRVSLVELGAPQLGTEAYHARNRWMVDRSDLVIGFPRGDNPYSGTWYTIHYGAEQARPRLIVPTMNDRATACQLLRRLREQRGWSWADQARVLRAVAEWLGMTAVTSTQPTSLQRSIARWEPDRGG